MKGIEGLQMKSHGRQLKQVLGWVVAAGLWAGASPVHASSLTVREVQIQDGVSARILLDGSIPKGGVSLDYVRDNVQFSILNSTIYPARILHAEGSGPQAFSKVFAYQYAPNLVRIRFTVDGKAEALKGRIKMALKGKTLEIHFPEPNGALPADDSADREATLLSKVLGRATGEHQAKEVKNVKEPETPPVVAEEVKAAPEKPIPAEKPKTRTPLAGKRQELAQTQPGPSPLRSLVAMFLVVGGLGLVLVYLKKAKSGKQAKRSGDSWLSGLLSGGRKNQPYIEVLANHALGPKQSITVVRIRDQQFVLGVTQDSVQLITQIDADETEIDVLDDPKIADSIGKMFGAKVKTPQQSARSAVAISPAASFDSILKGSSGAGAIVARNAYQSQSPVSSRIEDAVGFQTPGSSPPSNMQTSSSSGVREQIRKRLQGMNHR
jgi:flagellar biogenesis protein FliO